MFTNFSLKKVFFDQVASLSLRSGMRKNWPKIAVIGGMILPTVLKSNLIAQQVVSEGKQPPKQLSSKKRASVNGGGSRGC